MLESYYDSVYEFLENLGLSAEIVEYQFLTEVVGALPFIFIVFIVLALLRKIIDLVVGGI